MTDTATASQRIVERHDRSMSINYGRYPIAMVEGAGSTLVDADGNEYTDLFAGFGAGLLGHSHPELFSAVAEQANKLWHPGNLFHTEPQVRFAELLAETAFGGKSFFCHSGADANEGAIKLARLHGQTNPGNAGPRYKVISTHKSFHGRTFGAMTATGQPAVSQGFDPLPEGFVHVPYNDLGAIRGAIDETTAAVLLEPIQGEGGVNVPDDDFLSQLRTLCDEHDLLLMIDEVWTGGGRTGRWFAHQHWGITPDVMTLAKGVGGGLPVGVIHMRDDVAKLFDWREHGRAVHATTLGGNALCMAAGAMLFEVIRRDGLVERAARLGDQITQRLRAFAAEHPAVVAVRGKGLFLGVELDLDALPGEMQSGPDVVLVCMSRGVLINATQGNVLRLAPPLMIEQDKLDHGLDVLEQVLAG